MTIATYIDNTYGSIKSQLAWDSTDVSTITSKALQMYGVDEEGDATDDIKLEALVDVAVWKQVLADISLDYAFSADGNSYQRQQAVESVRKNLLAAETKAQEYLPEYQIVIHLDDTNADWYDTNEGTEYPE
jgi:hypothetical protein